MSIVTKSSYVDGAFVAPGNTSDLLENRNPSSPDEVIERFVRADQALTEQAIAAARRAAPGWARVNAQQRADSLDFIGAEILARRDELAQLLSREEGKVLREALIVLDDADLEQAVDVALSGSFYSTGQRCTATSRVIVTAGIHDAFVQRLAERTRALKVGDALAGETDIGPVVDGRQLDQNLRYVTLGLEEGATLVCGGEQVQSPGGAFFFTPALFTGVRPEMRIYREEIFGPVLSVLKVDDYEQALDAAEDTPFGLSAGIVTTSLKYAEHFKRHSSAGMVMVNLPTAGVDYHVPFGGNGASSLGAREQGTHARHFFTRVKTAYQMA